MFTPNLAYVSEAPSRQGIGYVWLNTDYSERSCSHSDKIWNTVMGLPTAQTKISVIAHSNKHGDGHPWDVICEPPSYGKASGVYCTHLLQHMPCKLRRTICYIHLNGSHYCSANGTLPNMLWHPPCPIFFNSSLSLGECIYLAHVSSHTSRKCSTCFPEWPTPSTVPQLQNGHEYRKPFLRTSTLTMNAHTKELSTSESECYDNSKCTP